MRKFVTLLVLGSVAALLAATGSPLRARAAANFKSTPQFSITSTGALQCSYDVSGLGNVSSTEATCSSDYQATRGCINQGDNQPSGLQRSIGSTSFTESVPVHNGRARGTITTPAPDLSGFSCPDHMRAVLVSITYTAPTVTVGGASYTGDSISRNF